MTTPGPISTWSSGFFTLAALAVGLIHTDAPMIVALMAVGVGSFLWHATDGTHNTAAHKLDEGSIYWLLAVLIVRVWNLPDWPAWAAALPLVLLSPLYRKIPLFTLLPALAALVAAGIFYHSGLLPALAAAAVGAMAGAVRTRLPDTDGWHGLWHGLAAGAAFVAWYLTTT